MLQVLATASSEEEVIYLQSLQPPIGKGSGVVFLERGVEVRMKVETKVDSLLAAATYNHSHPLIGAPAMQAIVH